MTERIFLNLKINSLEKIVSTLLMTTLIFEPVLPAILYADSEIPTRPSQTSLGGSPAPVVNVKNPPPNETNPLPSAPLSPPAPVKIKEKEMVPSNVFLSEQKTLGPVVTVMSKPPEKSQVELGEAIQKLPEAIAGLHRKILERLEKLQKDLEEELKVQANPTQVEQENGVKEIRDENGALIATIEHTTNSTKWTYYDPKTGKVKYVVENVVSSQFPGNLSQILIYGPDGKIWHVTEIHYNEKGEITYKEEIFSKYDDQGGLLERVRFQFNEKNELIYGDIISPRGLIKVIPKDRLDKKYEEWIQWWKGII